VAEAAVHAEFQLGFEQHLGERRIVRRPRAKPARSQARVRSGGSAGPGYAAFKAIAEEYELPETWKRDGRIY
jgi:hypothetical protein